MPIAPPAKQTMDEMIFAASTPHRDALFSLLPSNTPAANVLKHSNNRHLVSVVSDPSHHSGSTYGLTIGTHIRSHSRYTLATLGRSGPDITVEGSNISRIQCSFEVHETTGAIMLQDRSSGQSTQTLGDMAVQFEPARTPRHVLITPEINKAFGFGGLGRDHFVFRIVWHQYDLSIDSALHHRVDNPCYARTVNEVATVLPSQRVTRIHTGTNQHLKIRWSKNAELGRGMFGEVWSALNVDSGEAFAVKIVQGPAMMSHSHQLLKREVETLARVSHPNIVEYIAAQGWEDKPFEIFTELKDGSVQDLIQRDVFLKKHSLAKPLLRDMLQALDYLTHKEILHRDVKPANILYTSLPGGDHKYQLADFGLCNVLVDAQTYAGSLLYMAPELQLNPRSAQTPKMDIWSLLVTLEYALNASGFRTKPTHTLELRIQAVQEGVDDEGFKSIQEMAAVDPEQRASAADMLDKHFQGQGRTTVRTQIGDVRISSECRLHEETVERHQLPMTRPATEKSAAKRQGSRKLRVDRALEKGGTPILPADNKRRRPITRGITKRTT